LGEGELIDHQIVLLLTIPKDPGESQEVYEFCSGNSGKFA
jgi:hypothetical protein